MPFITEEIYQEMPVKTGGDMLIGAEWPDAEALAVYRDEAAERAIELVCEVVGAIRSARARYGISPKTSLPVMVKAADHDVDLLEAQSKLVRSLANVEELTVSSDAVKPAEASVSLGSGIEVYTILSGHVDFAAEKVRLEKEQAKISKDVAKLEKKLSNPGFLSKAAPEIVAKDKAKLEELTDKCARLASQLSELA